jgi:hypothetical protein
MKNGSESMEYSESNYGRGLTESNVENSHLKTIIIA